MIPPLFLCISAICERGHLSLLSHTDSDNTYNALNLLGTPQLQPLESSTKRDKIYTACMIDQDPPLREQNSDPMSKKFHFYRQQNLHSARKPSTRSAKSTKFANVDVALYFWATVPFNCPVGRLYSSKVLSNPEVTRYESCPELSTCIGPISMTRNMTEDEVPLP